MIDHVKHSLNTYIHLIKHSIIMIVHQIHIYHVFIGYMDMTISRYTGTNRNYHNMNIYYEQLK